jgi:hypothetical protein
MAANVNLSRLGAPPWARGVAEPAERDADKLVDALLDAAAQHVIDTEPAGAAEFHSARSTALAMLEAVLSAESTEAHKLLDARIAKLNQAAGR